MVFLFAIATMILNVVNHVLKRNMRESITIKHISDHLMTVIVRYDPIIKKIQMMDNRGACLLGQKAMDIMGLNHRN